MSTIGTFAKNGDGYNGTLHTLAFNVKAKITPVRKDSENGPDYQITANGCEIGAAWKKTGTISAARIDQRCVGIERSLSM